MSNYKGIDAQIERLKNHVQLRLWTSQKFKFYGRAYVNQINGESVPEVFVNNKDYKEVLTDDNYDAVGFVIPDNEATLVKGNQWECNISMYFLVNLSKIYSDDDSRQVERSHTDVINIVNHIFQPDRLVSGFDAVSEFRIKQHKADMQPYHAFMISGLIKYNYSKC